MQILEVNHLIGILIGIDIVFFIFLILLFKKLMRIKQNSLLENEIETFEALIRDSDKTAGQFNQQLKGKVQFIKKLTRKLDKRIGSLNVLLNRSNLILSDYAKTTETGPPDQLQAGSRRHEILKLAREGASVEAIARKLSIPRGEVMLTINIQGESGHMPVKTHENQMANGSVAS